MSAVSTGAVRAQELHDQIDEILEDGEFALVLTKEMDGFLVIPNDTKLRAVAEGFSVFDSLGPLLLTSQLHTMFLQAHGNVLAKQDPEGQRIIELFQHKVIKP